MQVNKIIDFLETDTISVTFSSNGLKYLSLKNNNGNELIDLKSFSEGKEQNPMINLLVKETLNFLETGIHNMMLDLTDFTPFQQTVFDTVSKIGAGNICTYKELGEALGKPGAAQAVGSAVAKNPVSYFIPTHRVLPQKGIGICRSGAGFLREKLLILEGHDIEKLRGNYVCKRKKCCME
ncbi:MGMT family protein [Clostridium bowmanii]|uniref:methylated-DNA--[protein]-cysteine S-methyltransferase n=1 Tax=Clostridium bowmanii TaxID=132925 RepID=UPI001C0CE70B|nr:MGMT family protein [Clostridium bowmanii]MBU3192195.1 MGMT family protein [Clostridium bowmanii]MCA1074967.1 MGMT family protein [Clostridium bowmanii]